MNFDELDFRDEPPVQEQYTNQEKPNNNSGKYNNNSGGYKKFERAKEIVTDIPYVPIAFYIDSGFPPEIKARMKELISKLLSQQYVVRINGDDKEFMDSIKDLSDTQLENYIPWGKLNEVDHKRYFNDIPSKHYFNTETSKLIAQKFFQQGWDKIPDTVKAFLARNARLLFGDKNNSCVTALITWSEDGATKTLDVSRATGKSSHVIKMAAYYYMPIYNLQNQTSQEALYQNFNLY